jgi:hypothetical protein
MLRCGVVVSSGPEHLENGSPNRAGRDTPMKPVRVTVITYAPTVFRHCQHCEVAFDEMGLGERIRREEAASALPEDLITEYAQVSDWIHRLLERHPHKLAIDLVDAASVEGVIRSLRHRVRRYPAVVVEGADRWSGVTDFGEVDRLIADHISERERTGAARGAA